MRSHSHSASFVKHSPRSQWAAGSLKRVAASKEGTIDVIETLLCRRADLRSKEDDLHFLSGAQLQVGGRWWATPGTTSMRSS